MYTNKKQQRITNYMLIGVFHVINTVSAVVSVMKRKVDILCKF